VWPVRGPRVPLGCRAVRRGLGSRRTLIKVC
jgi:hypothetical protein